MEIHEKLIRATIELALAARAKGNHPFGSLLALDGCVLLGAENTVITSGDITCHAELNLISQATRQFDLQTLAQTTLYTSTEPCAMCAGAIYWAGIRKLIFGCSAERLGEMAGASFVIPCRHIFDFGTDEVEVIGPLLEDEAAEVHAGFWQVSG